MQTADNAQYIKMTETPISRLIISLGVPTLVSMLVTSIYNMADTIFVGTLGTSASGAIGVVFGYMAILQAIGFMFGQGSGSLIARMLGQKDIEDATRIASTGFFTSIAVGLLITIFSLLYMEPLLLLLGSTPTILPYARAYCSVIALGAPFIIGSYVMNNILRYEGLAMKSMIGLVSGAVLNIVLDPILITGFHMGTAGAGIATVFSQMVSFCILLSIFLRGITQSHLSIRKYTKDPVDIGHIIAVGFPSLVRQALGSLATIVLNRCAGVYGDAAVAAMAIVNRISMFVFSVGLGLGQGYQPVCSFNYGAKKYDRVKGAFSFTLKVTMVFMGIVAVGIFAAAPWLVQFFRNDPEVIEIGTRGLRYACLVMIFQPVSVLSNMTLQSTGQSLRASFLAMLRSGVFFIPILIVLSSTIGLTGIEISQPLADALTAAASVPFIIYFFKKLPKSE